MLFAAIHTIFDLLVVLAWLKGIHSESITWDVLEILAVFWPALLARFITLFLITWKTEASEAPNWFKGALLVTAAQLAAMAASYVVSEILFFTTLENADRLGGRMLAIFILPVILLFILASSLPVGIGLFSMVWKRKPPIPDPPPVN